MVNIVIVDGKRYLVEVGYGSNHTALQPVPLVHDTIWKDNLAPGSYRLVLEPIQGSETDQKFWKFQHRTGPDKELENGYCFTETEFTPMDFEVMNWHRSRHPTIFWTQRVICSKMLWSGEEKEDGKVVGALTIQNDLKRRIGAESERITVFKTEKERLQALDEYFGITTAAIAGTQGPNAMG
jgi:arylamine N-acetyltransferase